MASTIKIKRSGTAAGAPASLKSGELAYTYSSGVNRLYFGKGDDGNGNATSIVQIGGEFYTDLLSATAGTLTASKALIVDASSKLDNLKVDNIDLNGNTISTLDANGNLILSPNGTGKISFYNAYTFPTTLGTVGFALVSDGAGGLTWSSVGAASTATNLNGGAAGQIPIQSGPGTTAFIPTGTSGQLLRAGTNTATFVSTSTVHVDRATRADFLTSARTITLAGDLGGNITFDGSTNVTLTATIQADSVALGTDTTGNYVAAGATSGYGLSGSASSEGSTFTVSSNATSTNVNSTIVFRDASGNFSANTVTASLTGNATSADKWSTARTVTLAGDLGGTATFDGSTNFTLTATIQADSVALGTDTTGNYVASGATSGYGLSGSASSEGGAFTVSSNATSTNLNSTLVFRDGSGNFSAGTITASLTGNATSADKWSTARTITLAGDLGGNVTFDGSTNFTLTATIQADSVALGTDTTGNYVATGATSGYGLSGSASSEGGAFTVSSNATSTNANSTIVFRDGSGNFSAGTITASLTGNATSADKWATARTVTFTGDTTGTFTIDGSANVSNVNLTIQPDSVALGTDTTGNYVATGATSGYGLSGSSSSESGTFTVTSNATSTNAASTIVFRDGAGNFSAGVVTANTFSGTLGTGGAQSISTNALTLSGYADNTGVLYFSNGSGLVASNSNSFAWDNSAGVLRVKTITTASSTTTGALVVTGGAGIGGNLYVGGEIVAQKLTIQLTTITTTLVETDDVIKTSNTTQATSTVSGALQVAGGAGIGRDLYVGGTIYGTVNGSITTASNIAGGAAGQIPIQSAAGTTVFIPAGSTGQLLRAGSSTATFVNTSTIHVDRATRADFLTSARTITLAGDLGGNVTFDGSTNVTLTATIQADSIALGTDTTGNYVATGATSGYGLSGSSNSEGGTFTVTSNATSTNSASSIVFRDGSGNFSAGTITATLSGNASTADKWATARTVTFTGDTTGTFTIDGSANVSNVNLTIQPDSVALGTDTTGNYVATGATSGYGLSGSASSEGGTFTVSSNGTSTNSASTLVFRDGSGNFSAAVITASLTGNATSADKWSAARTITLAGDLGGSVSLDGSTNVTLTATIQADSVALGTDTTGNYVAAGATSGYGLSGSSSSENATFTVSSNATSTNAASTIVFRNASGNFSAGVVTADLVGTASNANDLTGGAAGSIPYQSAAGVTDFLAAGQDGKVLVYSTATNAPVWSDIDGGTY